MWEPPGTPSTLWLRVWTSCAHKAARGAATLVAFPLLSWFQQVQLPTQTPFDPCSNVHPSFAQLLTFAREKCLRSLVCQWRLLPLAEYMTAGV